MEPTLAQGRACRLHVRMGMHAHHLAVGHPDVDGRVLLHLYAARRAAPGEPDPHRHGPAALLELERLEAEIVDQPLEPGEVAARSLMALVDVGLGRHAAGNLEDRVLGDQLDSGVEAVVAEAAKQLPNEVGVAHRARTLAASQEASSSGACTSRESEASTSASRRSSSASASRPDGAKAWSARPTGSSSSSTCAPVWRSDLRRSAWAQTAPNSPVLAPITATGLSLRTLLG